MRFIFGGLHYYCIFFVSIKVDFFSIYLRAFYLHMHGGVYADLDTWCLRPMDSLVNKPKLYLAEMSEDTQFGQNIPVGSYICFFSYFLLSTLWPL